LPAAPGRVRSHLSLSAPPPYFGFDTQLVLPVVRRACFNLLTPVPLLGPLLMVGEGHQRMARYMLPGFTSDRKAFPAEDVEISLPSSANRPGHERAPPPTATSSSPRPSAFLRGSYRSNRLSTPTRVLGQG